MALSIKTEEADRLARELARRTGRTMTEAVTVALRHELERTPDPARNGAPKKGEPGWIEHVLALTAKMGEGLNREPLTKAEQDEISDGKIEKLLKMFPT